METIMNFEIVKWMNITDCSEVQALNTASDYLENPGKPKADQWVKNWGVKCELHISDFIKLESEWCEPSSYQFVIDDDNKIIREGWNFD